ncbi:MAG TPA: hypothetical protein VHE34_17175 [Puia sp.]|uniref:ADP-ribosylation/crystallin J1 n=1 Tax=Puia sp. TaxID=2045100 RepID=UPI002B90D165|nr:ADP-ribosylation/crystallin J1 [Puia sp.]HVU96967.1 hypothetical protein [Puia sp.]
MRTVTLYRPVGLKELALIAGSGWTAFPPRLEWQPIFYPVLNRPYADQIASEWNTKDPFSGFCGVTIEFDLLESHFSMYAVQNVGSAIHDELWVPAEELVAFNQNIVGPIRVVAAFFGESFSMPDIPELVDVLSKFK